MSATASQPLQAIRWQTPVDLNPQYTRQRKPARPLRVADHHRRQHRRRPGQDRGDRRVPGRGPVRGDRGPALDPAHRLHPADARVDAELLPDHRPRQHPVLPRGRRDGLQARQPGHPRGGHPDAARVPRGRRERDRPDGYCANQAATTRTCPSAPRSRPTRRGTSTSGTRSANPGGRRAAERDRPDRPRRGTPPYVVGREPGPGRGQHHPRGGTNCAPAVTPDGSRVYVAITTADGVTSQTGNGYLVALNASNLAVAGRADLRDVGTRRTGPGCRTTAPPPRRSGRTGTCTSGCWRTRSRRAGGGCCTSTPT